MAASLVIGAIILTLSTIVLTLIVRKTLRESDED